MTIKTYDVIYSIEEDGFPIILEVVDCDDVAYALERLQCFQKHYNNVQIALGVSVSKGR